MGGKVTSSASEAARALNKARWSKTTKAERQAIASELGKARAAKMTTAERAEAARKAALARWAKQKGKATE